MLKRKLGENAEVIARSYDDRGDPMPPNNWRVEVQAGIVRMVVGGPGGLNMTEQEAMRMVDQVVEAFAPQPIPLILHCPECNARHIDGPEMTKPHRTHACQECGFLWAPSHLATVGVRFLPGCKNDGS